MSSFRYGTALEVHSVAQMEFLCPWMVWLSLRPVMGAVACRLPANSTCCVRRPTDEIFHLSAIAQMAARMVAQVKSFRTHTHVHAGRLDGYYWAVFPIQYLQNPLATNLRTYTIWCSCVYLSFSASRIKAGTTCIHYAPSGPNSDEKSISVIFLQYISQVFTYHMQMRVLRYIKVRKCWAVVLVKMVACNGARVDFSSRA